MCRLTKVARPLISALSCSAARASEKATLFDMLLTCEKHLAVPSLRVRCRALVVYIAFRLIELEFEDADLTGRRVAWPKYLNNEVVPIIQGVFCLYDVADQETVANVPQALGMYTFHERQKLQICDLVGSNLD